MVEAVAKTGSEDILVPLPSQLIKAREDLSKVLQNKVSGKTSIYDHIVKVVDRIVQSCPDRAIERFEEISYLIKNSDTLNLEEFVKTTDERSYARHCDEMAEGTQTSIDSLRQLFASSGTQAEADPEGEGGSGPALGLVQDLTSLNRHVFNQAGIELGEYGSLILQKSLKQLAQQTEARSLRFWGKISGTQHDYYVCEVFEAKNLPEDTRAPEAGEARGQGVNEYAYFVANQAQGPWTVLPDLDPQDLEAARQIKVCFSGNLERDIVTNPFYFRQEKHYLRAQIARIHHGTKLVPVGRHKIVEREEKSELPFDVEPNQPEDPEQPIPMPTTAQMSQKSSWVHYAKCILKNNRTSHSLAEEVEDREAEITRVLNAEPYEQRLKPITDDSGCKGNYPAWVLRTYGDSMTYAMSNPLHGTKQYNVVVVKSTVWPGAMSYFWQGQWGELYIGDGMKHEDVSFFPVQPPPIQEDPDEKPVHDEVSKVETVVDTG